MMPGINAGSLKASEIQAMFAEGLSANEIAQKILQDPQIAPFVSRSQQK